MKIVKNINVLVHIIRVSIKLFLKILILRHWVLSVFQDHSWTDIRCPFEKRRDATSVFWDNVVYILGGSQLFPIKRMDCYNVVKDSWYSKLGPPNPRDSLAACASKGKIYTSGGSEVGEFIQTVPWVWIWGFYEEKMKSESLSCWQEVQLWICLSAMTRARRHGRRSPTCWCRAAVTVQSRPTGSFTSAEGVWETTYPAGSSTTARSTTPTLKSAYAGIYDTSP